MIETRLGYLRGIAPTKSPRYTFQILQKSLSEEDSSDEAQAILKMAKKIEAPRDTDFVSIDIDKVADALEIRRSQVLEKLRDWDESEIIELGPADSIPRYRVLKPFPQTQQAIREIIEMTHNELTARDADTLKRSEKVLKLITGKSCYARGLAMHFEDINSVPVTGCGNCQWCLTKRRVVLKKQSKGKLEDERIAAVLAACPDRSDPELLAKVAFGVNSPTIKKYGFSPWSKVFGSMTDYSFNVCNSPYLPLCFAAPPSMLRIICVLITTVLGDFRNLLLNSKASVTTLTKMHRKTTMKAKTKTKMKMKSVDGKENRRISDDSLALLWS